MGQTLQQYSLHYQRVLPNTTAKIGPTMEDEAVRALRTILWGTWSNTGVVNSSSHPSDSFTLDRRSKRKQYECLYSVHVCACVCVQCACVCTVCMCTVCMCVQCACVYSVYSVHVCVQCACVYSVHVCVYSVHVCTVCMCC